jgi:hypothetical protein
MRATLLLLLSLALATSCRNLSFEGDDAQFFLTVVERSLADLETYSAAHEETAGDVEEIAAIRAAVADVKAAVAAGGDASGPLAAADAIAGALLTHEDPRIGQLAVALRSAIGGLQAYLELSEPTSSVEPATGLEPVE